MPLIQIRCSRNKMRYGDIKRLTFALPFVAAEALTCKEGGPLKPEDIMIEVDETQTLDVNPKDVHIRVWAHDYAERRGKNLKTLDEIRKQISAEVVKQLPKDVSWYVWVLLAPTSYGSDTEG